jgi:hypothetical protein
MFYKYPVNQSFITLAHNKTGLYFELWGSTGLKNGKTSWDDEVDYTAGIKNTIYPLSFDISLSYFDNFDVFKGPKNDVVKGKINLSFPLDTVGWFKSSTYVNSTMFIVPSKHTTFNGGSLYSVGFESNISYSKINLVSLAQLTWDDGAFDVKNGFLFKFSTGLNYLISKHLTLNVFNVDAYLPLGKRGIPNQFVYSSGLSWNL